MLLIYFIISISLKIPLYSDVSGESKKFEHTLELNLLPALLLPLSFGVNFEREFQNYFSINFEMNTIWLILPFELEVGVREYLGEKEFRGSYLYQGLALVLEDFLRLSEEKEKYGKFAKYIPNLILAGGYKYISANGFTINPFLGIRAVYGREYFGVDLNINLGPIGLFPVLGCYFGYSWGKIFDLF
jgi:hypothetical protein